MHLGRKTLSLLLSLALLLALLPLAAIPAAADTALAGSGTVENPYQIGTKAELEKFRDIVNGANGETQNTAACAMLTADIDLGGIDGNGAGIAGKEWTPIDTYSGTFDGQGHSITGLNVTSGFGGFSGLFNMLLVGGWVQNLVVGGTVTYAPDSATTAGGIVGYNQGTVANCRSYVNVTNSVSSAEGVSEAGGVVGYNLSEGTVTSCYATGTVEATGGAFKHAGGVVGRNSGTVSNCYATGEVKATGKNEIYAGGVVGYNFASITNCYATGEIKATGENYCYTGGIVGENGSDSVVTGCYYLSGTAGSGIGFGSGSATALTAAQFKDAANIATNFPTWDFADTWVMGADAPLLQALAHTEHDGSCAHDGWIAWSTTNALPNTPGAYYLTGNVTLDSTWAVPAGTTLLCLNGHSITGNGGYQVIDNAPSRTVTLKLYDEKNNTGRISGSNMGGVCLSYGNRSRFEMYGGMITNCSGGVNVTSDTTFNLYGGKICGNTGDSVVGVYVAGTFHMYGGEISGNQATGTYDSSGGGGVRVNTGTFHMYGGRIIGNTAKTKGGGVCVYNGTFRMYGGTITGNTGLDGAGGVFVEPGGTFEVSGDAQIYGNTVGGTADNVYLASGKTITVTGALDPYVADADTGAYIGVTMATPGTFTGGLSGKGAAANFFSDDPACVVRISNGEAALYQPTVRFVTGVGDVEETQAVSYNTATALAPPALTRAGYALTGWNTDPDGNGDAYIDGQDVTLTEDLMLFAQWTTNQFTVDAIPAQTADGTAKTPAVTVRDASDAAYVLTQDTHYTVSYYQNGSDVAELKAAGTYTVRVTGAGYYCAADTVDKTFTLNAPAPTNVYTGDYDPAPAPKTVQTFEPVMTFDGGTVAVSPEKAKEGDAVTMKATPDEGNRLWSLTAERTDGKPLMMTSSALGEARFTMPGCEVTVNAVFAAADAPMPPVVLSPQKITVNGVEATVEAYNIGGTNFFRLRDLAALLRGTPAQFDVEYDAETNAVTLTKGKAYAGEVSTAFTDRSASAVPSPQTVYVDGAAVELTAFNIGGYNFFGLRELAAIFGYAVGYDAATNAAIIESK